ncbi:hypothetical protein B0J18DRAFT_96699 [Chaetomium sp. MPI-SDFR-AT-0129]|nr:hypothetical protein B0J18DRAFT_96699 [Chaetomium sp. MPI-SDFR-AT-0129]
MPGESENRPGPGRRPGGRSIRSFFSSSAPDSGPAESSDITGTGAAPQPRFRPRRKLSASLDIYKEDADYLDPIPADINVEDFGESLAAAAARIGKFITGMTETPRDGLFERIGSRAELQDAIDAQGTVLAVAWNRLLQCYDVGMNGRRDALTALAAAYNKLHDVKNRFIDSERAVRELGIENQSLRRDVVRLQQWDEQQQQSIVALQDEVEEKTKAEAKLKSEYRNDIKTREDDIKNLEEVLVEWEELAGDPDEDPYAEDDDHVDHKARAHAIRRKIDEFRVQRDLADSRYRKAQERCSILERELDDYQTRQKSQESSPGMAVGETIFEAKVAELEIKMVALTAERDGLKAENRNVEKALEVERAHTRRLEEEQNELAVRLADQGEVPPVPQRQSSEDERQTSEAERQRSELAAYRDKCDILKGKLRALKKNEQGLKEQVHELKKTVADKTAEAVCIERDCQIKVQEAEKCIKDLREKAAGAGAGREKPASAASSPAAAPASASAPAPASAAGFSPVIPRTTIEEIEEAQLANIVFTRTAMEAIKAIINNLADKVVMEMAETKELRIEDGEQLLEEIQNIGMLAESWAEKHNDMEENQSLINDQLRSLRETVQENQNTFREIEEQAGSQVLRIEAANDSPFGGNGYGIDNLTSEVVAEQFPVEAYDETVFGAHQVEIDTLKSILANIYQMEAPLGDQPLDQAVRVWLRNLYLLQQHLDKEVPYTPTGDQLSQFRRDLRNQMARGIENDITMFYGTVARYKKEFDSLLRLDEYVSEPPKWEKKLLEDIRKRIEDAESFADTKLQMWNRLKIDPTQRPASLSNFKQSKIFQAVGEFLGHGGGSGPEQTIGFYKHETETAELDFDVVAKLVTRISELVVPPAQLKHRRMLRHKLQHQGRLLADLDRYLPKLGDRAKDLLERLETYDRLKDRGYMKKTDELEEVDKAFRDKLQRHEYLIRRDYQNIQTRRDRLKEGRAKAQAALDKSMEDGLRLAERMLILALLKIRSPRGSEHNDSACFCLLLRHFFPSVYYSTITDGCCAQTTTANAAGPLNAPNVAGQLTAPPQPQGQLCQGHHSHGVFPSPGALWTTLCHILTFVTWVIFLFLTEPERVGNTILFVCSAIDAVSNYIYRLVIHIFTRVRLQILRQRYRFNTSEQTSLPPPPEPPHLNLPAIPPPSALLNAALLLFTGFTLITYVAVEVERRVWLGDNDWRFAYVLDITSGKPLPYPAWSPVLVDYRLAMDPVKEWLAQRLHDDFFTWRRRVVE